jgi:hypothetical protein
MPSEPALRPTTDSITLRERLETAKQMAERRRIESLRKVLSSPEGVFVWVWIRRECCLADKAAPHGDLSRFEGRRDVAYTMDLALKDYPDLMERIARLEAQVRTDDAMYHADSRKLEGSK